MPGRPFKQDQLEAKLGLKPLSDTPGLEGYSRDSNRVEVGNWPGGQYVVIIVHKKAEIDTPAFREFLLKRGRSRAGPCRDGLGRCRRQHAVEEGRREVAPRREGLPAGQGAKWDRALLPKLVKLLREIDPKLEWKWDVRDAITIRPPGVRGSGAGSRPRNRTRSKSGSSVVAGKRAAGKFANIGRRRRRSKATATTAVRF